MIGFGHPTRAMSLIGTMREQAPRKGAVRLMLAIGLLGLVLAGVWQGEIHAHADGSAVHSHLAMDGHDEIDSGLQPEGSSSKSLHLHDAVVTLAVLGPPEYGTESPRAPRSWSPDPSQLRPPASIFTAPHRPPIV